MRLHFYCSYQDLCEYQVTGCPEVERVEVYREDRWTNDYMLKDHNHCGDPTSFERNVLSRQGGAVIRYAWRHGQPFTHPRWTQDNYAAFVQALRDDRRESERKWSAICDRHGWEEERNSLEPMRPIPAPKYWDTISNRYETEPWYDGGAL
jgi:hypothetical protein